MGKLTGDTYKNDDNQRLKEGEEKLLADTIPHNRNMAHRFIYLQHLLPIVILSIITV